MASSDPELKDGFTAAWMKKPTRLVYIVFMFH